MTRDVYREVTRSVAEKQHGNNKYTTEQRKLAAATYLLTGSVKQASEEAEVPHATVKDWTLKPWWDDLLNEIRREHGRKLSIKLNNLLIRNMETIVDRIENGDVQMVWNKSKKVNEKKRVPISLASAIKAHEVLFKQQRLLEEQPTSIMSKVDGLKEIAEKLRIMGAKDVSAKVIEAEVVDDSEEQDLQV